MIAETALPPYAEPEPPRLVAGRFEATDGQSDREEFILRYSPLVHHVARSLVGHLPPTLSRQDLFGYGVIGLIEAVDRYDPRQGVKFETFASRRIWGAMVDALRAQGFLSRTAVKRVRELNLAVPELEQQLSRTPTRAEVARHLGTDESTVEDAMRTASLGVVSLDTAVWENGDGDSMTLGDVLTDQEEPPVAKVERAEELRQLAAGIEDLLPRQRLVLALYYHEELTLREIGRVMGVTESRVCQLHAAAIRRLRRTMTPDPHGRSRKSA